MNKWYALYVFLYSYYNNVWAVIESHCSRNKVPIVNIRKKTYSVIWSGQQMERSIARNHFATGSYQTQVGWCLPAHKNKTQQTAKGVYIPWDVLISLGYCKKDVTPVR